MLDAMVDTKFDTDEYLHLALHANSVRNHHACMSYLKEVLSREPQHAKAIYLLAVQHAELGLQERAIAGMRAALALEPGIEMARLQLGLLLLDRNRTAEARETFEVLENTSDAALQECGKAMIALADGDVSTAEERLRSAATQRTANSALPSLIRLLLDQLAKSARTSAADVRRDPISMGAYGEATKLNSKIQK